MYLEQLRAAVEIAETGVIPDNAPVVVKAEGLEAPESVSVGDQFDIRILVEPNGDQSANFSLMTALNFWQGFELVRVSPNPRSSTEFWGRRAWSYGQIDEPMTVTVTLEAIRAGQFALDLDVERSFDVLEFGIVKQISVEE